MRTDGTTIPSLAEPVRTYEPGTKVEVRRRLDARWARGFEVVTALGDHRYRVRRLSDGHELPVAIAARDLQPERPLGAWV